MQKICGIYCITNMINGKQYVGLSKDCYKRWSDHYSKSYTSEKEDDIRKPLYQAMKKYGRENFSFMILEECNFDKLKEREIYWIEKLKTYDTGYNATRGGDLYEGEIVLKGENHGMHKLTQKDVEQCRKWYQEGKESKKVWEENYKNIITYSGFQRMWHGKTWKDIMPEVFENNPRPRQKLSVEDIKQIKEYFEQGKTCAEVYHIFNEKISRTTINDIRHGRRYADI